MPEFPRCFCYVSRSHMTWVTQCSSPWTGSSTCFGCSVQLLIQLHFQVSVGLHPLHVNPLMQSPSGAWAPWLHHHLLKLGAVVVEVVGVALQNKIQFPFFLSSCVTLIRTPIVVIRGKANVQAFRRQGETRPEPVEMKLPQISTHTTLL